MSPTTWLAIAAIAGIPMLFFVAAFVIGCFERHPVRQFRPAELPQLPPYVSATMTHAGQLGFTWIASGVHAKFGEKVAGVLLISPDRLMLALIGEGKILGMPSKQTHVYSRLKNANLVCCTDKVGSAELDPGSTRKFLMNAGIAELVDAQRKLISNSGAIPEPFQAEYGWQAMDAIFDARAARMVQAGLVTYCDGDHGFYRYRPWAAFRVSIVHGVVQSLTPKNLWRNTKSRAG